MVFILIEYCVIFYICGTLLCINDRGNQVLESYSWISFKFFGFVLKSVLFSFRFRVLLLVYNNCLDLKKSSCIENLDAQGSSIDFFVPL